MLVNRGLLLLSFQIIAVLGYSTSPSTTTCGSQLPDHPVGGSALNTNSPVTLTVTPSTYQSGSIHQVTLTGGPFTGFFVQARRQDGSYGSLTEAIGQFGTPPGDTQLLDCSPGSDNGWGHSNGESKSPGKSITWTAPSSNQGSIRFRTPIVEVYNETSAENSFWAPDVTTSILLTYSEQPVWSVWGSWGSCSTSCGPGIQWRTRSCIDPVPSDSLNTCAGSSSDSQECSTQVCPEPVWSSWGFFTLCSVSCGSGTQYRTRACTDPNPDDDLECEGGAEADDIGTDTRDCNEEDCLVATWGPWTPFVGCSRTCAGGTQTRTRKCEDPDETDNDRCTGLDSDTIQCNTQPCPGAITGQWGVWEGWSGCSELCDLGQRTRTRPCYPTEGSCSDGPAVQSENCFIRPCDGNTLEWNEWQNWGSCSVTCGPGTRQRVRNCEDRIDIEDRCYGDSVETQACNHRCCDCGDVKLENLIWIIVGIVVFFSIVGVIAAVMCVYLRAGFRPRHRPPKDLIGLELPPPRIPRRPGMYLF